MSRFSHIGVLGGGAWGTALAQTCARACARVTLSVREAAVRDAIITQRENSLFLPGVSLIDGVSATTDMAELGACDLILAVSPAQHLRASLKSLAPHVRQGAPLVVCAKGVEEGSLKLMSEVATDIMPTAPLAVLSGPSFAIDVARGLPTAVTLAIQDLDLGAKIAAAIATPSFRPYLSDDVIGVEVGGAVKNVLAIACGVVEGKGLGRSAHAALITRGLAEMTRLAVALGGRAETLAGLSGLGDLVLTCSSSQSRNMSVGLALGQGIALETALSGKLSVAEGVASAPAVTALATRLGVDMPICHAVADLLAFRVDVDGAIGALLSRPLRRET